MSSLKFTLRKIDETKNFLLDEIKHNDLMNERYRKTGKYLNYVELLLILVSTVTCCVSFSAFASLVFGITSSVVGINICAITAKIKKYKSIRKNKNDKIVLLGFLISKSLIDSNASVRKTNQHRLLPLSNCAISGKKKSTFIKNQGLHNFDNILND